MKTPEKTDCWKIESVLNINTDILEIQTKGTPIVPRPAGKDAFGIPSL